MQAVARSERTTVPGQVAVPGKDRRVERKGQHVGQGVLMVSWRRDTPSRERRPLGGPNVF